MDKLKNFSIEDAEIIFRNFSGRGGTYNSEGSRNFCVVLDPKDAVAMKRDGWAVRYTKPRDEEEEGRPYIQVSVKYGDYPPKIYMVTSKNQTLLDEDTVGELDRVEIEKVDLIINPYYWNVNGKSGIKAYCKTMYVTIAEDFGGRYASIPTSDIEEELPF